MYENELKRIRDYIAEMKTAEIRGIEKGIEKGIKKGIEKGIEKGEEQGIELTKKVFKLLSAGYTKSQIAKECDISESKVEKILE